MMRTRTGNIEVTSTVPNRIDLPRKVYFAKAKPASGQKKSVTAPFSPTTMAVLRNPVASGTDLSIDR